MMKKILFSIAIISALLSSCGGGNEFKVSGTVENGANETLLLERSLSGRWIVIDSVKTDGNGDFSFAEEAPSYPEIFRLDRKGRYIYFPIDSIDKVTIETDTAAFDSGYRLGGTANAVWMMKVDSISHQLARLPFGDTAFKAAKLEFAEMILENPSSIVAYYTVNKIIGDRPLYSITDKEDVRILGAVANAYDTQKPNDPRTELLKNMFFAGRRNTVRPVAPTDTFYVNESQIIDITLIDRNGNTRKLSDEASKGNVLILNFTTYLADESPALNAHLAELYRKYSSKGFQIYQICYDANEFNWKSAAKNLPWITVYDPAGAQSSNLLRYNVGSLPAIFIINRNGELSERVIDINELDKVVAKYI